MEWSEEGIVVGTRRHGEADVILEVLTAGHGRHLGLVKGGRSRRLRPVLQAGNTLALTWRARLHEHLGNFRAEPVIERSSKLMASPMGAFGLALAGAHLRLIPERDPHPRLFEALSLMLDRFDEPALAAEMMARFEVLLLDELGFGLDLESCAATGHARRAGIRFAEKRTGGQPRGRRALSRPAAAAARHFSVGPPTGREEITALQEASSSPVIFSSAISSTPGARACPRCGWISSGQPV